MRRSRRRACSRKYWVGGPLFPGAPTRSASRRSSSSRMSNRFRVRRSCQRLSTAPLSSARRHACFRNGCSGCDTVPRGGVPERSNGAVLKTVEPHGSVSSNLTPAAFSRALGSVLRDGDGCRSARVDAALAARRLDPQRRRRRRPDGRDRLLPRLALARAAAVGVSIGKDASCYELLRSAGRFAISLLGSEQEELARRFAAGYPPIVHWQGVPTREGQVAPLIEGALGWIEAATLTEADAGDHTFFIADVLSIEHGPSHHALVYRESNYHSRLIERSSSTSTACSSSRRRSGTRCASATSASAAAGTTTRCSGR